MFLILTKQVVCRRATILFAAASCAPVLHHSMHSDVHVLCDRVRVSYVVPCFVLMCLAVVTALILLTAAISTPSNARVDDSDMQAAVSDELSYGIIIDAGSSGSRLFLYCWPSHTQDATSLIQLRPVLDSTGEQVAKKVSPGLSSFADSPSNATEYVRPLLDYVMPFVPEKSRASTPLFLLATAGMRLLDMESQQAILSNLRRQLPQLYPFQMVDSHIDVISGKWEGVYSWIAVNYILGSFDHTGHHYIDEQTQAQQIGAAPVDTSVAMIDMGGASVQIAFEYTGPVKKAQSRLFERVNLGCQEHDTQHEYQLYVVTFLGFGANEALERYEKVLLNKALLNLTATRSQQQQQSDVNSSVSSDIRPSEISVPLVANANSNSNETLLLPDDMPRPPLSDPQRQMMQRLRRLTSTSSHRRRRRRKRDTAAPANANAQLLYIRDPCLPVNHFMNVPIPRDFVAAHSTELDASSNWLLVRRGQGNYSECMNALRPLLHEANGTCEMQPCSMNGVHQPEVDLEHMSIYAFSEYWYSMYDILGLGGYYDYKEFTRRAADYCATKWSVIQDKYAHNLYPRADRDRLNTQCAKAAWIMLVLHEGFGVPTQNNNFRSAQKINEQEVQWTMGALLHKMRYFPLRDIERRRLEQEHRERTRLTQGAGALNYNALALAVVVLVVLLFLLKHLFRLLSRTSSPYTVTKRRPSDLPRNQSIWGYMMLRGDGTEDNDRLLEGVRVETADYVY